MGNLEVDTLKSLYVDKNVQTLDGAGFSKMWEIASPNLVQSSDLN